jgi:hypothetical protein
MLPQLTLPAQLARRGCMQVFVAGRFDCLSQFVARSVLHDGQRPVPFEPSACESPGWGTSVCDSRWQVCNCLIRQPSHLHACSVRLVVCIWSDT